MNTIILIIALQIVVVTLAGCTTLQDKMEEQRHLTCNPPHDTLCIGWHI
jgi:hypothetical protein